MTTEISRFWARDLRRFDGSARVDELGDGAYRILLGDGGGFDFNEIVIVVRTQQSAVVLACNDAIAPAPQVRVARGDTLACEVRPLVCGPRTRMG